jgi:hypothetical protein
MTTLVLILAQEYLGYDTILALLPHLPNPMDVLPPVVRDHGQRHIFIRVRWHQWLMLVIQTAQGGRDQEDCSSKPAQANSETLF